MIRNTEMVDVRFESLNLRLQKKKLQKMKTNTQRKKSAWLMMSHNKMPTSQWHLAWKQICTEGFVNRASKCTWNMSIYVCMIYVLQKTQMTNGKETFFYIYSYPLNLIRCLTLPLLIVYVWNSVKLNDEKSNCIDIRIEYTTKSNKMKSNIILCLRFKSSFRKKIGSKWQAIENVQWIFNIQVCCFPFVVFIEDYLRNVQF